MSTWTGNDSRKARARIGATLPAPCWRCGGMIQPEDEWQVGHIVDRALGGTNDPTNLGPEHPLCNMRAGGQLAQTMAAQRRDTEQQFRPGWWLKR